MAHSQQFSGATIKCEGSASSQYSNKKAPFIVSITSGKGGVGKTLTTVNLALSARRLGLSVLVLDGDLGLANVDVVLGLRARYNIRDVLDGQVDLNEIIVDGPMGMKVIPSGSGITSLTQLGDTQRQQLLEQIERLEESYDVLLIDTGAGISDTVLHLNGVAKKNIIVTTPEPHAMTDAYAMIKVLCECHRQRSFSLIVNMTRTAEDGEQVHERISEVARKFLGASVDYLGNIPLDPQVPKSVLLQQAASEYSTHTISGQAWNRVAQIIFNRTMPKTRANETQQFWRDLLWTRNYDQVSVGARM